MLCRGTFKSPPRSLFLQTANRRMGRKHSRNACSNPVFTYAERQKLEHGTITRRLGAESIKDFCACSICLKDAEEPVSCPDGHLFCKGCIYEDLLSQKAQIKARTEQWERQQEEDRNTAASKAEAAEQQKVANFFNKEMSVLPTTASAATAASAPAVKPGVLQLTHESSTSTGHNAKVVVPTQVTASAQTLYRTDGTVASEKEAKEARDKNLPCFWIPSMAPELAAPKLEKPDEHTYCSEGKHILRVKQLKPVKWTRIENMSDADERGVRRGNQNRWMCHACRRTLTNSTRMMHLRNCGHVVCFTCAQTFITTDGACTCGVQAPSNDSVSIASGGSGYSGGGASHVATKVTEAFRA